jgi:hypothetical protein
MSVPDPATVDWVPLSGTPIWELIAERTTPKNNTGLVVALPEYNFDGGLYWIEAWTSLFAGSTTSGGGGGGNTTSSLRRTPSGGAAAIFQNWMTLGPGGASAGAYPVPFAHVKHRIQPPAGLAILDWYLTCTGTMTGNQVEASAGLPAWLRLSR